MVKAANILPIATASILGGVKPSTGLAVDGAGVLTTVNNGTVTSVALTVPGLLFSVAGSPITTSGTFAFSLNNQNANTLLAGPTSGGATTPTMRTLVDADIPTGVTASKLSGALANATIAGSAITGSIADGLLSNNVPLKNAVNSFTAANTINAPTSAVDLTLISATGQTSDVQQWVDGSNNVLSCINAQGSPRFVGSASPTLGAPASTPTLNTNSTTGGTLAAGMWKYAVTNVDSTGLESPLSSSLSVATTGTTSAVTINISAGTGASKRNIYRTAVGGSVFYFLAAVADNTTLTYQDTGAVTLSTKMPPLGPFNALAMFGSGPFDGTTSGFFSGTQPGTVIGVNLLTGSSASLIDLQYNGVTQFKVSNGFTNLNSSILLVNSMRSNGNMTVWSPDTGARSFYFKGATAQSANLTEWQNPSSNVLAKVDAYGNISTVALPVPGVATLALAANATGVDLGAHTYGVTFVNANGETTIGTTAAITTTSGNLQVNLSAIPLGANGVTSRKIYRSKAGTTTPLFLVATLADNTTTTYSDTATDASLPTTTVPTVNLTMGSLTGGKLTVGSAMFAQNSAGDIALTGGNLVLPTGSANSLALQFTANNGLYYGGGNSVNIMSGGIAANLNSGTLTMGQFGTNVLFQSQNAGGGNSNRTGVDMTIRAGAGTGSGTGGEIIFQVANSGATATTLNTQYERMRIGSAGTITMTAVPSQSVDLHQWRNNTPTTLSGVRADGLIYGTGTGTTATNAGIATAVKAGTPADADWSVAPPNGTIMADSTGSKLWVRLGGAWKSVVVA